jgi:hypothetical protein
VESSDIMISAIGIPGIPLSKVVIENVTINCKQFSPRLHDVDEFTLRNISIHSQDNKINI